VSPQQTSGMFLGMNKGIQWSEETQYFSSRVHAHHLLTE